MAQEKIEGKPRASNKRPRPLDTPKTSIRSITDYLIAQISGMGFSVAVSRSRISKSRYLEVDAGKRWYTIRVSDHALRQGGKYDFDIYTDTSREKSWHYLAFLDKFRSVLGEEQDDVNSVNIGK